MTSIMISVLILPLVYIVIGAVGMLFPPKKINSFYGFRTARSRQNQETWDFANRCFARSVAALGGFLIIFTLILDLMLFKLPQKVQLAVGIGVLLLEVLHLFIPIYYTQSQLKFCFDESGKLLPPPVASDTEEDHADGINDRSEVEIDESWAEWSSYDDGWEDWKTWSQRRDAELSMKKDRNVDPDSISDTVVTDVEDNAAGSGSEKI